MKRQSQKRSPTARLRAFAQGIMKNWPEDVLDAWEIEELAIKHGLLKGHKVKGPCADNCLCAEVEAWPQTCYRRTMLLTGQEKSK